MTDDRMTLIDLIQKGADGDLVRDPLAKHYFGNSIRGHRRHIQKQAGNRMSATMEPI
ncbi:hypothetical protein HNR00_001884 [Methylorubrum rhodinum]|uniref:Uncharacterized protein n=1 Tax=Methylorubrum rhodinum TaxID=29428 RepID=A0A840ZK09_9HYPH|nr:hypothetical protein [Methylorubrum rhodinum]MBB5757173.1 hypothetical protein [Methylorubrum rhodinum]